MDTQIKLGTFVFQNLEVPEEINFGGEQQLVQHDLIGGQRVIDALGKNDIDITWKGLMYGSDALSRAQQLNQLRVAGNQLTLTWFSLNYNVIIQNFVCYTEKYFQVRYEITLRVVSDNANPINTNNLIGFNEAIKGDLATANQIAANVNIPAITETMAAVTEAVNAVPTFNGASTSTISPVITALEAVSKALLVAIIPSATALFGTPF